MVGAGTVLADDPALTVRLEGHRGPQPLPVVIAGRRDASGLLSSLEQPALVFSPEPLDLPAEVVVVPDPTGERVDLAEANRDSREPGGRRSPGRGRHQLWPPVCGSRVSIDRGVIYVGAVLAGGVGRGVFEGVFATIGDLQADQIHRN